MKLVSVIVPVYGVEKYIASTVQSVLDQTYPHFELLLVDDGSPDRSVEICQQFSDPRLRILRQQNRGLAGARNTGIRQAQGDYIALLDGDDLWLPEKLERHVAHLEASPQVGISFSPSALMDESGQLLGTFLRPQLQHITLPCLLQDNPIGNGSAPVLRRAALEDIKFQDNLYGTVEDFFFDDHFRQAEDLECWLRMLLQTDWQIEGIPPALTRYRVNSGGLSAGLLKQLGYLEQVMAKVKSYAPEAIAPWENPARAYQLRYLARSAVRMKSGALATQLIHRALTTHWKILLEQPRRTLMTLMAAYSLRLLPQSWYEQVESQTVKLGSPQKG